MPRPLTSDQRTVGFLGDSLTYCVGSLNRFVGDIESNSLLSGPSQETASFWASSGPDCFVNIATAFLISLKGFTEAARKAAADCRIDLIEERQMVKMPEEADATYDPAMVELLNNERQSCPRYESPIVLKMARKGSHAGETFWSCSRYPACDGKFST